MTDKLLDAFVADVSLLGLEEEDAEGERLLPCDGGSGLEIGVAFEVGERGLIVTGPIVSLRCFWTGNCQASSELGRPKSPHSGVFAIWKPGTTERKWR